MSIFGEEFDNDWPSRDFTKNLTNFGQELLEKSLGVQNPKDEEVNIQEFIKISDEFPIQFPIDTCRIKSQPAENYEIIKQQIASAYPLLHERVLFLILNFLEHKLKCDSSNTCQNCQNSQRQYDTKFDQLTESVNKLKGVIEALTAANAEQTSIILNAFAKQEVLIEKLLGMDKQEDKIRTMFPISSLEELSLMDNGIKDTNRAIYIRVISSLLKGPLHKSLTEIFSVEVILACNLDGIHGKVPFKDFKRLFDALMEAVFATGQDNPEKAIRNGLKLIKKRHFQAICVNKKKDTKVKLESMEDIDTGPETLIAD